MKISNAAYPSPNLRYDPAAREVIFERLNPETGDVTFQVPSRETLREEAHAAETGAAGPNAVAPAPVPLNPPAAGEPDVAVAVHAATPPAKSGGSAKGTSISILV
ncbi:MAG TPA: hypothetical protein VHT04_07620 [Stellaceae bacterium]|jgi:hypothetical protein|nr:hypothetical protein [Stellaceae bacterium]